MPQTASRCQSTRAGMKNSWLANPWLTPSDLPTGGSSNVVNRKVWSGSHSKRWPCSGTPTNAQTWDYDAVGNWDSVTTNSTTQTRGANRQNEITSVSSATTPTYDNNGNLTKDENDNRFVWDAWNMLVQVKNSSNVVLVTYGRDALHRHVTDTVGSSVTDRFFSTDWQVLETKVGSNTITRNVWSPAYVDALVLRDRDTDSNGTLDERVYSLQDANWNTTGLVNTSGSVVERDTYSPFGVVTFRDASGSVISASTMDWLFLHQGGQTDSIGNYDFRNRVYSPTLGRWLTNDPIGFSAGDVNTFRYVGNGPGNGLDPFGLQGWVQLPGGPGRNCAKCHPLMPWISNFGDRLIYPPIPYLPLEIKEKYDLEPVYFYNGWILPMPKDLETLKEIGNKHQGYIDVVRDDFILTQIYHRGASSTWRLQIIGQVSGNQGGYTNNGSLITEGTGSGSADKYVAFIPHILYDVIPWYFMPDDKYKQEWKSIQHRSAPLIKTPDPVPSMSRKYPGTDTTIITGDFLKDFRHPRFIGP